MKVTRPLGVIGWILSIALATFFFIYQKGQSNKTNEQLERVEKQDEIMKEKNEISLSFLKTLIEHDALDLYKQLSGLTETYPKFNKEYPHIKEKIKDLAGDAQKLHDKLHIFAKEHYGYKPEE